VKVLRRFLRWVIGLPVVAILVALGLANDQPVSLVLDPFRPANPAISLQPLPFYLYLFGALTLGVIAGGLATWAAQAHVRRSARKGEAEARRWRAEVERINRERQHDASRQLASAGR
jgi:hypothetical protein